MLSGRLVGITRRGFGSSLMHSKPGQPWVVLPGMVSIARSRSNQPVRTRSNQPVRTLRPLRFISSIMAKSDGAVVLAGNTGRLVIFRPQAKSKLPWLGTSIDSPSIDKSSLGIRALKSLDFMFSQSNLVFTSDALRLSTNARVLRKLWINDRRLNVVADKDLKEARETLILHKDTHKKVERGTKELENALVDADELRQASRIATRIAIVALLIYLIQIVFNRYRYLQRISGFYRARAQALRILASSAKLGGSMLADVSATDLMAALSPDSIGFDKSGEPPGQNMMSTMLGILRRDKKL